MVNRSTINAAAFLLGFLLMIAAGHASAQNSWVTNYNGHGCTKEEACTTSSQQGNTQLSNCDGMGEPETVTGTTSVWFTWRSSDNTCIRSRSVTTCAGTNTYTSGESVYSSSLPCPTECEAGATWGGPVQDAYDLCSSNGCAIESPVACSGDGTFCNSTLTGETCTNQPYDQGCPGDQDCDGYPDETDECPSDFAHLPGSAGCPCDDDDNDGVCNVDDQCPGTVGNLTPEQIANGCGDGQSPDSDGDGVPDDQDQCPNSEPGAAVESNGCAFQDSDGDGVRDSEDQCPNTAPGAVVESNGCAPSETPGPSPSPSATPTPTPGESPDPSPTPGSSGDPTPGPTPAPTATPYPQEGTCPAGATCENQFDGADLGSVPSFGETMSVMTGRIRNAPIMAAAGSFAGSIPSGGTCPSGSFAAPWGGVVTIDGHCALMEQGGVRATLAAVFLALWAWACYRVFMSA